MVCFVAHIVKQVMQKVSNYTPLI